MKVKLTALDRLIIPKLLPAEGSILEQLVVKEIKKVIQIPSKDWPRFGIWEKPDKMLDWDPTKIILEEEKELSEAMADVLRKAVDKLDKAGKVSQFDLDTCVKIQNL